MACSGFNADKISGASMMPRTPRIAMVMNQASMMGPKMPPMNPVPLRCTMKSPTRIRSVSGTMIGVSAGASTLSPSKALRTEIAGVIAPSP
jgi:hypothetical protein